jgi:CPA2 family monovalent cation:H+ antiporter-2
METTASSLSNFSRDITILLAVVAFATASFRKFGWNPILGLIAAGAAIGPQGFGLMHEGSGIEVMGDIGILFLLFIVGMELSPERLKAMARWILGLGSAHFIFSTAGITALAHYAFKADWGQAAVIGVAGSMSSTAFVLQLLAERKELTHRFGQKTFSVLLFQDLMAAPILAFLPLIAGVSIASPAANSSGSMHMLPAIVCMFVLFVVVRMLLESILGVIHATARSDAFPAAILFTALAMGSAANALGLSSSLGAFLAGFAISGAAWRREVRDAIDPFETTLLGFFFIGIGLKVPLSGSPETLSAIVAAAVCMVTLKAFIGIIACLVNGVKLRPSIRTSLALAQAGEFSFVVLVTAFGENLIPQSVVTIWGSAAVLSLIATPFLIKIGSYFDSRSPRQTPSQNSATDSGIEEIGVTSADTDPKGEIEEDVEIDTILSNTHIGVTNFRSKG